VKRNRRNEKKKWRKKIFPKEKKRKVKRRTISFPEKERREAPTLREREKEVGEGIRLLLKKYQRINGGIRQFSFSGCREDFFRRKGLLSYFLKIF
jgi:hypothetical protein